jgi:hypothetical protein
MEPQPYAPRMQDEFIAETEAADPEYVVSVEIDTSWLVRPESDRRVLAWTERFLAERYELVGVADAAAGRVLWDDEARSHVPGPQPLVRTYRRRR